MYEILKVLNHNTILVLKENEEIIVMSKGIGFGKKQGEQVDVPRNAKQYKMFIIVHFKVYNFSKNFI